MAGTIERTYDLLDRITEEVTPEGAVSYTYDDASRRASMTVAGQSAVSYTFDDADQLTGITQGTASVSLIYDNDSRRTSLTLPNGVVTAYGYDDDSQLTGLTYTYGMSTLGALTYGYDANGQRVSVGGTWARTTLPAALSSASYDDANQIATFGGTTYTYDNNGNLTSDGVRSYVWNARNQLASLTGPVNGSFAYDAFGRRRSKMIGSSTTEFLYDGLNPAQELAGGIPTADLLTGLQAREVFTRTDSAGARSYLTDAQGSSTALADGSGVIQTEYTYEPFGATVLTGSGSANSFGFRGREFDNSGVHFTGDRYVVPGTQRFIIEGEPWRNFGFNFYADGEDPASKWHAPEPEILIFGQPWWVRVGPGRYVPRTARPFPRPTPPPVPRHVPVDPRIPPIQPKLDPWLEMLLDWLKNLSGSNAGANIPPESDTSGRKPPDCYTKDGILYCKA